MQKELSRSIDKRRLRGDASRKQILQSAIHCIASKGLGNTTLNLVADQAGVSKALVVFHFKSKNLLIKEVLEFLGARYEEGWNAVFTLDTDTTMEKLIRIIDYDIRFACENPEYVSAWHAFWGESKGNSLYHELAVPRDNQYAWEVKKLLSQLIIDEGAAKHELPAIARGLKAMLFGIWNEFHLDPGPDDYTKGMEAVRLFLCKTFPGSCTNK